MLSVGIGSNDESSSTLDDPSPPSEIASEVQKQVSSKFRKLKGQVKKVIRQEVTNEIGKVNANLTRILARLEGNKDHPKFYVAMAVVLTVTIFVFYTQPAVLAYFFTAPNNNTTARENLQLLSDLEGLFTAPIVNWLVIFSFCWY
jgi:hypothetical protein